MDASFKGQRQKTIIGQDHKNGEVNRKASNFTKNMFSGKQSQVVTLKIFIYFLKRSSLLDSVRLSRQIILAWKYHFLAEFLFNWFGFNQTRKSVVNSAQAKLLNPNK